MINIQDRILTAAPAGELDHYQAERLRTQIDSAFEKSGCRHLLLDMRAVSFMDSSGIGMIIGRYKMVEKRGGRLVVANMSESVTKLFDISGLSKIVSQADSTERAISMLGGVPA
ncbi:MAG: anti-sigma factor antagonist [Defluviitaleaceae bacterium]|nr:anti-sigma factor antagonist [Defluviitaleaceae bacterium]